MSPEPILSKAFRPIELLLPALLRLPAITVPSAIVSGPSNWWP